MSFALTPLRALLESQQGFEDRANFGDITRHPVHLQPPNRLPSISGRSRSLAAPVFASMKCQKCERPATFHITELEGGKHTELHLCEEHARGYLTQGDGEPGAAPSMGSALAQHLAVGQTAEELKRLDQRSCPICGITFYEFRNQGRLGCPHDYVCFEKELEPLIANIHGETVTQGEKTQTRRRRHPTAHGTDSHAPRNERSD